VFTKENQFLVSLVPSLSLTFTIFFNGVLTSMFALLEGVRPLIKIYHKRGLKKSKTEDYFFTRKLQSQTNSKFLGMLSCPIFPCIKNFKTQKYITDFRKNVLFLDHVTCLKTPWCLKNEILCSRFWRNYWMYSLEIFNIYFLIKTASLKGRF